MTNLTVHLEAPGGPAGQNCPMTSHTPKKCIKTHIRELAGQPGVQIFKNS